MFNPKCLTPKVNITSVMQTPKVATPKVATPKVTPKVNEIDPTINKITAILMIMQIGTILLFKTTRNSIFSCLQRTYSKFSLYSELAIFGTFITLCVLPSVGFLSLIITAPIIVKKIKKTKIQKHPLHNFTCEGDNLITDLKNFLVPMLETYALPVAYIATLASSLVTVFALTKHYISTPKKKRTTTLVVAMVSAFVNLVSTAILGIAGTVTAEFPWQQTLDTLQDEIVEEIGKVDEKKFVYINEKHKQYVLMCKEYYKSDAFKLPQAKKIFQSIYADFFSRMDMFILPRVDPPFLIVGGKFRAPVSHNSCLVFKAMLKEWPIWFIAAYYGVEEHDEIELWNGAKPTTFMDYPEESEQSDGNMGQEKESIERINQLADGGDSTGHDTVDEGEKTPAEQKPLDNFTKELEITEEDGKTTAYDEPTRISKIIDIMFSKVIALFASITSCLLEKKKITPRTIITALAEAEKVEGVVGDFKEILKVVKGDPTTDENLRKTVTDISTELTKFNEMPTHQFALHPRNTQRFREVIDKAQIVLNSMEPKIRAKFPLLQTAITTSTVRKNELLTTELPSLQRQEPFLVLLRGEPFVGKTELSLQLSRWFAKEILQKDYHGSFVQITPSDKYWPPLGGQEIALFDDAATNKDLRTDLLFSNLKGICSPAYFNASAADIAHKINPIHFQVIFATINSTFDNLAARVTEFSDNVTWAAMCRRAIVIDMTWKDQKMVGNLSKDSTLGKDKPHKKNFSHANLSLQRMDGGKLQHYKHISVSQLKTLIQDAHRHECGEFERRIRLDQCIQESEPASRTHFSVVIHGRTGQGKTYTLEQQLANLTTAFAYPLIRINNVYDIKNLPVQRSRAIVVMDDVVKENPSSELQEAIMEMFNTKLVHASIIVTVTNVSPKFQSFTLTGRDFTISRKLPFQNEGVARRLGYKGVINGIVMPTANIELHVENFRFHVVQGSLGFRIRYLITLIPILIAVLMANFYSLLFAAIYTVGLFIVPVCFPEKYEQELTPDQLPNYVYTKYGAFIEEIKTVSVQHGLVTKPDDCNFEIYAKSSDVVEFKADPYEMEKHVLYDRARYEACDLDWKLYLDKAVFEALMDNYKKFMIEMKGLDYDKILAIVQRYVMGFRQIGIAPRFYVQIDGTGKFSFLGNCVMAEVFNPAKNECLVHDTPEGTRVAIMEEMQWKFVDPRDVIYNPQHAFDNSKMQLTSVIAIREFVKTPRFLNHPSIKILLKNWQQEEIQKDLAMVGKSFAERYRSFKEHPLGRVVMILFTIWVGLKIIRKLTSGLGILFGNKSKRRRQARKQVVESETSSESETESEVENQKSLKGSKKPSKKVGQASDLDKKVPQKKKLTGAKKPAKKTGDISDLDKKQKQTVNKMTDMNSYDAFKAHIDACRKQALKAMVQIYVLPDDGEILHYEPRGNQSCYGLIVGDDMLVTVGHVVDSVEERPGSSVYACCDEFEEEAGSFKSVRLSLIHRYPSRDISVWYLNPKLANYKPQSLRKRFVYRKKIYDETVISAVLERFGTNKQREYHCGDLNFFTGPDACGKGTLSDYGQIEYGTFGIKLTTYGDCGLPYYACEPQACEQKILGIHCMGNNEGYTSCGVVATIFEEDYAVWLKQKETFLEKAQQSQCCKMATKKWQLLPDTTPKGDGHVTLWNPTHESTRGSFANEFAYLITTLQNKQGRYIKNSGKLHGSIEHSHLQFIPNTYHDLEVPHDWLLTTAGELEIANGMESSQKLSMKTAITGLENFADHILRNKYWGDDFRCNFNVYTDIKSGLPMVKYCIITTHINKFDKSPQEQIYMSALPELPFGNQVYASEEVKDIITTSLMEKQRGVSEDMPYKLVSSNETVRVIGVFRGDKSHKPTNTFKMTPFAKHIDKAFKLEHKKPFSTDMKNIPEADLEKIVMDLNGEKSQLATQSIQWAHRNHNPGNLFLKEITNEFQSKVLQYYSNMDEMTDQEVLEGCSLTARPKDAPYFCGMALDKSVGFTMKELFYVQKKSDILTVDELGHYKWLENEAAHWLREQFQLAKSVYARGEQYFIAFLELLKMEKLKESKRFVGRTFLAQDILGVLLERKYMGEFAIRAMRDDPNCGVGVDAHKDFNRVYNYLNHFQFTWAADYKRFDRTIPGCVFQQVRDMLVKHNPKIGKQIYSVFNSLIYRFQITGRTLSQVYGGMPSGCTLTAPLNSLVNDYIIFSCFASICSDNGMEWNWQLYDKNVRRIFYGDDVYLSVSAKYSSVFTRTFVASKLLELYGMVIDSSVKDGGVSDFDTWETGTWISRYFRKLDRYPHFVVGALKKISINSHFYYVTSLDATHIASLLDTAMIEAALWDEEYYNTILECVRLALKHMPSLRAHLTLRDRLVVQHSIMKAALPKLCDRQETTENLNNEDKVRRVPSVPRTQDEKPYFQRYHQKEYYEQVIKPFKSKQSAMGSNPKSYISQLNEKFQSGIITILTWVMQENASASAKWKAKLSFKYTNDERAPFEFYGYGNSKTEAKEGAAFEAYCALFVKNPQRRADLRADKLQAFRRETYENTLDKHGDKKVAMLDKCVATSPIAPTTCSCKCNRIDERTPTRNSKFRVKSKMALNNFRQEMNVTPQSVGAIPQAPMTQTDVSVVTDSGLFTNTNAPSPAKIINSVGIALDNPAGSGAPFNKHVSVYNIYQRWEAKNTVLSPALPSGTEIVRISLDPKELPQMIRSYIDFHESFIPALDIVIAIAGAAGTIGWIATGWVKDASSTKKYTLQDLQQVAMEESNMNGTQIIKIKLTDVRRMGLYRRVTDDPEPFPGIIMMVDHAVTNVQRNDAVNYPVRVQVRLDQTCILMEPFNLPSSSPATTSFDLGSYFYDTHVDALIGSSAVADDPESVVVHPDSGFNVKDFSPVFGHNCVAAIYKQLDGATKAVPTISNDTTPSADYLKEIEDMDKFEGGPNAQLMPNKLIFSFGETAPLEDFHYVNAEPTLLGSTYALSGAVRVGIFKYNITSLVAQANGCYIVMEIDSSVVDSTKHGKLVVYNSCNNTTNFDQTDIDHAIVYDTRKEVEVNWIFQEFSHNKIASGNPFRMPVRIDQTSEIYVTDTQSDKKPTVYVQTGNSMPSTTLPTGLKQLSFVRSGTTTQVTEDLPFVPLYKPIIKNAFRAFDEYLVNNGFSNLVRGDLYIAGENKGQIGYQNSTFFVRTDDFKKIFANIGQDIKIKNIADLPQANAINAFNTTGMSTWISSGKRTRRRLDLNNFHQQSATVGGAVMTGLGNGFSAWGDQLFQERMQNAVLANNRAIAGANNAALAERQKAAFERNLELKGYNSSSSQYGLFGTPKPRGGTAVAPPPRLITSSGVQTESQQTPRSNLEPLQENPGTETSEASLTPASEYTTSPETKAELTQRMKSGPITKLSQSTPNWTPRALELGEASVNNAFNTQPSQDNAMQRTFGPAVAQLAGAFKNINDTKEGV
ncbi:polyprotein [Diabrotica virgifera virgifera virus 2]|uniref:polyprotein n=1 Tax=Diabrotica virgifera virgifera virus 2 TaxID=1920988 RepID=UPI0009BCCE36|nr:polyprotein [Diabrotica virgifera virgifera virus 2]APF29089.1 polyprotein [Diabrotica virgifera virgifera virus 2]